ncbi:MAG: PAS domain S-box protein [Acidobacteriota bacterium]|nr:PAS domain S-box protein [Acidobacteriota bacterium]
MSHKSLKILLVHDATGSRLAIRELLSKTDFAQFELDYMTTDLAFRGLRRNYYSVCVVDSAVKGMWILEESRRVGFATPIIMLTSNTAYEVLNAMRHGAADCLVREALTAGALEESICVVIERARYKKYRSECARRYLGLVENSSEIIYIHDLQGNSTFLSKAGERLIGYTGEEIRNTNFSKMLSPECIEFVWRSVLRMLADRKPCSYEAIMVTKEGQRIPVGITMHLVYKQGKPIEVLGIVRDLSSQIPPSALTESERFSRVILTL